MRNVVRKFVGPGAALVALVLAAGVAQATVIPTLSLTVDQVNQTWSAYLTLSDPSSETSGLFGLGFNVWGSQTSLGSWTGPLAVTQTYDGDIEDYLPLGVLPSGVNTASPVGNVGFAENKAGGTLSGTGYTLVGAMQSNTFKRNTAGTRTNIIVGVGEAAFSHPLTSGTLTGTNPVLVGQGSYTGTTGWLNISALNADVTLLPAVMPTVNNTAYTPFPSAATGSIYASIQLIPEPGTVVLLATGLLGLLAYAWRRRRA